jgi:hypothetical protein
MKVLVNPMPSSSSMPQPPTVEPTTGFQLSAEQRDTAELLERLLGKSIADRYLDFCQLSAGAVALRVSSPMAGHALRELESILRRTLMVAMEAKNSETLPQRATLKEARKALRALGFDDDAISRAVQELKPRLSHKAQIRTIVARLGLDPDGDIAVAWLSICEAHGKAHERPFHRSLSIDDDFRATWQQPLDVVVRGIALALRGRYIPLMRRVEELVAMQDRGRAVALFEQEVPGALPLQRHFFHNLKTPNWLPHLIERDLVGEPYSGLDEVDGNVRYREWPAGDYLLQMAQSTESDARSLVAEAIRKVAKSKHPDVRRKGIAILAALPPEDSVPLADIAAAWLEQIPIMLQHSLHGGNSSRIRVR